LERDIWTIGYGYRDRHGLGDMDMETWTWRRGHGDVNMETWTWRRGHGDRDMETWTLKHGIETWNFKLKTKNGSPGNLP
jgi:hypothetical protein